MKGCASHILCASISAFAKEELRHSHLHMCWMASWSPSQSEPLIVSYACQRQSSTVMLPRAALMPPCAATVCERVGNSLVMHLQESNGSKKAGTVQCQALLLWGQLLLSCDCSGLKTGCMEGAESQATLLQPCQLQGPP